MFTRAFRLKPVLDTLEIPKERWHACIQASSEPAAGLARALGAELAAPHPLTPALSLATLTLPPLPISLEPRTALIELRGPVPSDLAHLVQQAVTREALTGRYVILLDRSPSGQAAEALKDIPLKVAVLDERDITRIVLAPQPPEAFCRVLARTAKLGDISPYQTSGGLDRETFFVGRRDEIALLTGPDARNHLLIGARKMGKSSILKSLQRRDPGRIHLVTLASADLEGKLRDAKLPSLDELGRLEPREDMPVLLLDEADLFIAADRARDFAICRQLRALSEEGRCRFVLAGFWELHHAAFLDHQSPIRNLANPISLGPLDDAAAATLATKPLDMLGLTWASDDLIAELLRRAGNRPNLIAIACHEAIRALPPLGKRVLDEDDLRAVLDVTSESGQAMAMAFRDLGSLTGDQRACRIDRMVMYATVARDSFKLLEVYRRLKDLGAVIPMKELEESVDRLTLAYVLRQEAGAYSYPVPLVCEVLVGRSGGSPDEMLEIEVSEWNEAG